MNRSKPDKFLLQIFVITLLLILHGSAVSQIMTVKGNSLIHLKQGSILAVKGGLDLNSGSSIVHDNSGISNLLISGKFNYLGTYTQNTYGILRFFSNRQDTIAGNNLDLSRLWIAKYGTGMLTLAYGTGLTVHESLRLVSDNLLNIDRSDLIIDSTAVIYPDSTSNYLTDPRYDPFSDNKHITSSGDSALSGKIIRRIKNYSIFNSEFSLRFPTGSPNDTITQAQRYYTPVRYVFNAGQAWSGKGAFISVQNIATEHYATEVKGVALKKYWKVAYDSVIAEPGGYNIRFNYNQGEVQGFEDLYMLNLFYRPHDGLSGTFYINPGAGYGVEPINNRFYVDEVNKKDTLGGSMVLMDGEWTAGQEEAISTFYYSRTNGDWTNPSTWSKQGYNGVASLTYPSTLNDKVFIGNGKTVSVATSTPEINRTIIDTNGRLLITNPNAFIQGDSLYLKNGGTLAISSPDGFHTSGAMGNVRTTKIRSYSNLAIYEFVGSGKQVTGPGIPDIVRAIVINKNAITDTVSLTKSVLIKDSLVINQGAYHLFLNGNYTSNGETGDTTNRQIIMRGGELITQSFLTKYTNSFFTAGTVTFDGTGSFRVPSSESPSQGEPAVTQYYNLSFKGTRGANTFVTLDPTGQIRIGGLLDISKLSFNTVPLSDRFLVTGSKVVFNGSGDQDIPTGYAAPTGINFRLKFHDLIIDGPGIKNILAPNDDNANDNHALIRSLVNIKQGTLKSNNHWIKVLGNWLAEPGSIYDAGSGLVTFEADGKVTSIVSNGTSFNNLRIMGTLANGYVNFTDNLNIAGNLEINPNSLRTINGASLSIQGNWLNKGVFVANTGSVYFNGAGDQKLDHNGTGEFYNLTVNKTSGMVRLNGDSLINITRNLTLIQGNIGGRLSDSLPNKPLVVDGSITRQGGLAGHVDGRLRLFSDEGNNRLTFEIGLGNDYAPVELDIKGPGGAPGYLDAYVLLDLNAPNITRPVIETQSPNGSELDSTKNVRKVWVFHADTTGSQLFALAASRDYDMEFFFPASDVRNGANTGVFEIGQRDTTINTGRWSKPFLSSRRALSTKFTGNQNFNNNSTHFFILGEPKVFTYYSIADGLFNNVNTWSTAGYESTEPTLRAPLPVDNIRIGNGKTVTLNLDHVINANRLFVVETGASGYQNGHLIFDNDTRFLSGAGIFRLDSGAAITIKHSLGIVNVGSNTGCVRTTTANSRQYNGTSNHNRGNFIYAGTGAQATGNGFPATVQTLQINKTTGTLTVSGTTPVIKQILDSIYIKSGSIDLSNTILKVSGNFVIDNGGTFNPGSQGVTDASGNMPENNRRDSVVYQGVVFFNGSGIQYIHGTYNEIDSNKTLDFNRFTLSKRTGKLISRFNILTTLGFLNFVNRANLDMASYNKYFEVYHPTRTYALGRVDNINLANTLIYYEDPLYGYIEGRLIRYLNINENQRLFPIGTAVKYAPVTIRRDTLGASTSQVAGLIEVEATEGNHPNFSATAINQNTNIQRYYEISRPIGLTPAFTLGDRPLGIRMYFTSDEPRGGINPINYKAFRLLANNTWSLSANISSVLNTSTNFLALTNLPNLGGNNIFTSTTVKNGAPSITLMIGESPVISQRVFYSRNSGLWNDPNTWANEASNILYENTETGYAIPGNAANDWPKSSTTTLDFAIIGAGDSVYFNAPTSLDLQYVQLEKSTSGTGKLVMPPGKYLRSDQYVQKNGGKLLVGDVNGIVSNSTTTGCIRKLTASSIVNFDWNTFGINQFSYIGTATQVTGSGLPNTVGCLEINYTGVSGEVSLSNDANLIIRDSIVFLNGTIRNQNGNRTITVQGDIVNHSSGGGFNITSNRAIILDSTKNQQIRGTSDLTAFPSILRINKLSGTVTANRNAAINSNLNVLSNTLFNVADNRTVTFGNNAEIDSIIVANYFNSTRMFKVSGSANTGKLRKTFVTGNPASRSFTFPVGEDSTGLRGARYGEAKFDLNNMDFAAGNYLELTLRSLYPHPSLINTPNMLSKYWSVNTNAINRSNGTMNTRLRYNDSEVNGNILNYRPAMYRRTDISALDPGWSSTIFGATNLDIDTTNKYIIVDGAQTLPYHDWSAGNPTAFAKGRVYWSRQNGDWTNPNTWTNINSQGLGNHDAANISALNYPGYYAQDTVYIGSNHVVVLNRSLENAIDTLGIGITSPSTAPELQFQTTAASHKSLNIAGSLMIGNTGLLSKSNALFNSIDTLYIKRDISNSGGLGRGINIHPNAARNLRLVFNGADSTKIIGEGTYTSIGNIKILKADSVWNTVNKSVSFSNAFSNSVITIPTVDFSLEAGMYVHDVNAGITLSTDGDGYVFLGDLVGIVVRDGNVEFKDGLICGQNSSVWLINGDMTIGNAKNDNFQYESVTIIDIAGTSKLKIAGSMRRRFTTSNVDFRLKDNAQIEVMIVGAQTNSSERRAAFDFGEANSFFKMQGNTKVIIYKPMEKSIADEKDPDYVVSATAYTVTGGTVQFGDPLVNPTLPEPFNLIASVPFWNLDLANTHGNDLLVGSPIVTVRNDMTIRNTAKFNQNGNNLNIGGDFIIDGQYKTGNLGTRRLSFFGDASATPATKSNQTLMISSSNSDPFYDFAISKADSGQVFLSNSVSYPNSKLVITNTLEFSVGNRALINTGDQYVQVGTNALDLASIQRFGRGHINGFLRRWINNGPQERLFTVGTTQYTPATVITSTGTGTEGILSIKAFGTAHPDISNAGDLQTGTHIDRYWQVLPVGTSPFILGDRSYTLTTQFIKGSTPTGDVKPGSSFGIFEHFRRTDEYPNTGTWYITEPYARTDSTTTSINNIAFGDIIIGEISGLRFFSALSGDWNATSTWVIGSYSGAPAIRAPVVETDRVFIGNGKAVTIQNSSPRVRSVTVEIYNTLPGKLVILDERYLRGLSFSLNDNCYISTDDAFGFTSVSGPTPNIGAVRATSIRSYGKSTYEFLGVQSQAMGDGPLNPKTVIVNNAGVVTNGVSFSTFTYNVEDTLLVQEGGLLIGNGTVNLKGQIIVENGSYVRPNYGTLNLNGVGNQYFIMNDSSGVNVYNLKLTKTAGNLFLTGSADSASLSIERKLTFDAANVAYISGRSSNKKVFLTRDTTIVTRTGTGHIDGYMIKQFGAASSLTYKFDIGYGALYMPATLVLTAGTGTAGLVAGCVNSPPDANLSRIHPTRRINYFWVLSPWSTFELGSRTANTTFQMPASQLANLTGGVTNDANLLRRSIPTENPSWVHSPYAQLTWNVSLASVSITAPENYWTGLGEFYISEKYSPTFYSRQSGNWNDNNTWTLGPGHSGVTVLAGDYPNCGIIFKEDNVYIGLNHIVTLNIPEPQIDTLVVRNDSKLDMGINAINCDECTPTKGLFDLQNNATIAFGGSNIPSSLTTMKNFVVYGLSPNSTIEYTGIQIITPTPFSPAATFTNYPGNVRISGLDSKYVNLSVLVNGNFYVNPGASIEVNADALKIYGNFYNSGNILNTNIIEIGN